MGVVHNQQNQPCMANGSTERTEGLIMVKGKEERKRGAWAFSRAARFTCIHHASSVLHISLRRGADTSLTPATRAAAVCGRCVLFSVFVSGLSRVVMSRSADRVKTCFFLNIWGRLGWDREVFKISLVESGRARKFSNPTATGGVALTVSDPRKAVFSFHHVSLVKS